ncbi:aminotransferase class I/II-fold pyridoxal phosphate-dependent enzyme [Parvicella tangerina]|uniref:8-amino-7-oxononanoate synthase n=1 Tax=Parvicella tangerina TaxID=2829795 RepID=A0A916NRY9_9FLAO|nr:pyridoxal phosphate-dependent aminotransferase family protein [Parvicella tangerina]CAG5082500.1 8-amino-7-oxononanoate synthase [Parvicella tangerina]
MSLEKRIAKKLADRKAENTLRSLELTADLVDFSSNDYLGLGKNNVLIDPVDSGSTGSRLLSGNYHAIEQLEKRVARITKAETSLIYSSGYAANVGLLSSLPQRGDVIFYDELVHASIRDGIRLSHAKAYSFVHNDLRDLKDKLEKWSGDNQVFVVVESVYSMDGDDVGIQEIRSAQEKYRFNLLIDEAHSFGLSKEDPFQQELASIATARVITFGKALGADGAAVLCSDLIRNYLINFSRSFIYSTAPSPHKIALINEQLNSWEDRPELNKNAQRLKATFRQYLSSHFQLLGGEYGNIVSLILGDIDKAKSYAKRLQKGGYDVRAILSPTVPKGSERLRICFHDFNTQKEVEGLISLLLQIKKEEG